MINEEVENDDSSCENEEHHNFTINIETPNKDTMILFQPNKLLSMPIPKKVAR